VHSFAIFLIHLIRNDQNDLTSWEFFPNAFLQCYQIDRDIEQVNNDAFNSFPSRISVPLSLQIERGDGRKGYRVASRKEQKKPLGTLAMLDHLTGW
jgi:hypothetical protein